MKRILVVDDDKGALTLIGIMLERGGFQVLKAKEGNEAMSLLETETPDMIILDLMMPGLDGFNLTTLMRQRPQTAETPILILSARSDANSVISSMDVSIVLTIFGAVVMLIVEPWCRVFHHRTEK